MATEFLRHAREHADKKAWRGASRHPIGFGSTNEGIDMGPAILAFRSAKSTKVKGIIACITSGGYWTGTRRKHGKYTINEKCHRCKLGAADTPLHFLWTCPRHSDNTDKRVQITQCFKGEAIDHLSMQGGSALFLRGLLPNNYTGITKAPERRTEHRLTGPAARALHNGIYATDGSGGRLAKYPRLRRCGWCWVQVSFDQTHSLSDRYGHIGYGNVEGNLQTVPRAELIAILQCLKATTGTATIYTDHLNHVKRHRAGPGIFGMGNDDLWEEFWSLAEGRLIQLIKVKAHAKVADVAEGLLENEIFVGNEVADQLSGYAAQLFVVDQAQADAYLASHELARAILDRCIAIFEDLFINEPKHIKKACPPVPRRRLGTIEYEAVSTTEHDVVFEGRKVRCERCKAISCSGPRGRIEMLHSACRGTVGEGGIGKPHPSHVLCHSGKVAYCSVCGCWGNKMYRGLYGACPKHPTSPFMKYLLGRFSRGLLPPSASPDAAATAASSTILFVG
jgi:hypothetical protein